MEKIERLFRKYSWLIKLGIVLMFIWVLQLGQIPLSINRQTGYEINTDGRGLMLMDEKERKAYIELNEKIMKAFGKIIAEAEKKSERQQHKSGYTPRNFFEDKKKIRIENTKIHNKLLIVNVEWAEKELWNLQERNRYVNKNHQQDFNSGITEYKQWLKKTRYLKSASDYNLIDSDYRKTMSFKESLIMILGWVFTGYWRGILPILLLYFVRMLEGDGIFKSIRKAKKKFALAVLAWPAYFWKYPHDALNEMLFEAEHRRKGNIFRKLTKREKKRIKYLAQNYSFRQWSRDFRKRNASKLQHAFLSALIVTVFMHFVVPVSQAQNKTIKKSSGYQQLAESKKGEHQQNDKSPPSPDSGSHDEAETTPPFDPPRPAISRLAIWEVKYRKKERQDEILCVPCAGCLVKNTKQPEQSFLRHRRKSWTKRLYKKLYKRLLPAFLSAIDYMKFHPTCPRNSNHKTWQRDPKSRWIKIYS